MASVSVTFTPVYGVHGSTPLCYLLAVDGVRILLDCGWTEGFDTAVLEPLRALAPTLDLVLLSHPSLEHTGALPMLMSRWGCTALVLSTLPVRTREGCAACAPRPAGEAVAQVHSRGRHGTPFSSLPLT